MNRLPLEGEMFGRYRLLRRLGAGGMGVVFAAYDPTLDREVALKLVAPHLAHDEEFRARFAREAALLAKLDSSRAVRIHDQGEHDGVLYIVTQLIDGGDLSTVMRESGALSPALAVDVVCQVLEGLGDAHAVGVVHRDVKPGNVLVRQRAGVVEAFLCDFGVATTAGSELTRTGNVAGSLQYMAPERHQGADPGPSGDIYAAGCLLWFALSGSPPYIGTEAEVLLGHLQGRLPQLPGKDTFSKRVNSVLTKALAKEPGRRYATTAAMASDLQALKPLAAGALQLPGATAIRHSVAPPTRNRWRASLVAVVAVLAVVGASLSVRAFVGEGPETTAAEKVEVTTTIRGPQGRNIAEQRTLLPLRSRSGAGPVVVPQEPGPGGGDPDLGGGVAPDGGGGAPAPTRVSTPASSTPKASTTTAAPAYKVQCWNGTKAMTLDNCGTPTGVVGARWIYSNYEARGCGLAPSVADTRVTQSYLCKFGEKGAGSLYINRFATPQDARSYLGERLSGTAPDNWTSWSLGAQFCGYKAYGQQTYNGVTTQRFVAYYNRSGVTWGFWLAAPGAASRDWGVSNLINRYARLLPEYQGVVL